VSLRGRGPFLSDGVHEPCVSGDPGPPSVSYTREQLARLIGGPTAERVFTLVDLPHKRCRIVEERKVKGAAEWAAANRRRAGGPVVAARVDGLTVSTDAHLAEKPGAGPPAAFGPAEDGKGGEVLDECFTRGKDVVTRWRGLAGAGVGLAASLGLAAGVLEFRAKGLEQAGGSRAVEIEIVTPGLHRMLIGIDDTDTPISGATWALAREVTSGLEDMAVLSQRVVQLFPGVPTKTTNCVATIIEAAVAPWMKEAVKIEIRDRLEASATSDEVGLAFAEGITIDRFAEAAAFCDRARRAIVTEKDAQAAAHAIGAQVMLDGRGMIGAVAALGAAEMGPEAADLAR
jgi:methanogenesis imperfect marker protein 11